MADTATLWVSGQELMIELDPASGSWAYGLAQVGAGKLAELVITASGGPVTADRVMIERKYPFVDLASNTVRVLIELSRPILFEETASVAIPDAFVEDGTTASQASVDLAIVNESLNVSAVNPTALLDATSRIVLFDPDNGDDAAATAANGGLGYYTLAVLGADPSNLGTLLPAYRTLRTAQDVARGSTSNSPRTANAAVLHRRGSVADGATDYFIANGGIYQNCGGVSKDAPFVIGQYGLAGDGLPNPILRAQQTVAGGAVYAMRVTSTNQCIAVLGVDMERGVDANGDPEVVIQYASSVGVLREHIFYKRCDITGVIHWFYDDAGFRQIGTAFDWCVVDGDNATGEGGIMSTDGTWGEFHNRRPVFRRCLFTNAGDDGFFHGFYVKCWGDLAILDSYFYDISGACAKIDSCWGGEIRRCVFAKTNFIGAPESNGQPTAGLPTDRTKDDQTTEYPVPANSAGSFSKTITFGQNLHTDALAFGERGSLSCGLISNLGPSHDIFLDDNLGVYNSDNNVVGITQADDGGSSDGYLRDTWDALGRNNTITAAGTTARAAIGFSFNPADDDNFSPTGTDQVGHHGVDLGHNVVNIGPGRTGNNVLVRFGTEASDQDYGASFTAGRSQLDWNYNVFYDATGFADRFRNGGTGDVFSTLTAFEADMNSVDASMLGNSDANPGATDLEYQISTYFASIGHTLASGFEAIRAGITAESIPANLTIEAINAAVRPKHQSSLAAAGFAGTVPGVTNWSVTGTPQLILVDATAGDLDDGDTLAVEDVIVGDAASLQLTLRNDGDAADTIGTPVVTGDLTIDAGDNPDGASIAPAGTDTITIDIDTSTAGEKSGTLTVPSADPESPFVVNITTTVLTAAALTVTVNDSPAASGGSINAGGDLVTGTDQQLTLTLTNSGQSNLNLGTITLVGALTFVSNPSNQILQGGESTTLVVRLDTANTIVQAASIGIPSNAASTWTSMVAWDVIPAPAVVTGPTGPAIEIRYLSVAETDAIIAAWLPSTDQLRMVWDATTDTDKPSLINQATTDFDQVRLWRGQVAVPDQPGAWPRISRTGVAILPGGEPEIPASLGQTAWTFAGLPRDIRIGVAIQAAARAAQAAGVDSTLTIVEQGHAGIASKSAGGQSVSINTTTARSPSSILHPKTMQRVKSLLGYAREAM